jgi:large subunit ribosomal protein L2
LGYVPASGRSNTGKISVHHRGGGTKSNYLLIDSYRRINHFGLSVKIIKTRFRTSFIGLILYENGVSSYILLSGGSTVGARIYSGSPKEMNILEGFDSSSAIPIKYMGLFSLVNNIERYPFGGIQVLRAAGMNGLISMRTNMNEVVLKLKPGWNLFISEDCICSSGSAPNAKHRFFNYKRAGYKRSLGIRPTVRGVAMNPCDHPHGGGEGRKSPPAGARSPWGSFTKGTPTNITKILLARKKKFKIIR